jgi:hypothetical protein
MMLLYRAAALALPLTLATPAFASDPKPGTAKAVAPATAPAGKTPAAKPPDAPAPGARSAPKTAVWKEYELRDSAFAVKLPAEPQRDEAEQGPLTMRTYGVDLGDGEASYGVVCMSFQGLDGDLPPETLDQMASAMGTQFGGKLTQNEKVTVAGLPARDLKIQADEGQVSLRVVLAKRRLYQLMALRKGGELPASEVKAFFESFRPLD